MVPSSHFNHIRDNTDLKLELKIPELNSQFARNSHNIPPYAQNKPPKPPNLALKISMAAKTTEAPSLSFPRDIFAALSPSPFLLAHLSPQTPSTPSIRPNGRAPSEFRKPTIHRGSLTHCSGSAVVRLGDTAVVCGVRGEILLAADIPNPPSAPPQPAATDASDADADDEDDSAELSQLSLLVPNIELATGSTPTHLPGSPPSTLAQSLTARLRALLLSTRLIRARDLRILHRAPPPPDAAATPDVPPTEEAKAYWTLYIDTLFISLDGNAFDAAWAAVVVALRDTRLPRAWWDDDVEAILCSDVPAEARALRLRGLPVAASFAVFAPGGGVGDSAFRDGQEERAWVLSDPDAFEEALCPEVVTVTVDCTGGERRVRRIEKSGGSTVGRELMKGVVQRAEERWKDWLEVFGVGNS
ncbi:ribosomal protein S5 domain 2-like protein [Glonium stellatum]|uniref:Ribosomal RNA-processing protein 43 n=1 Tax=Glonium stellatum TaxID=574774 RepID=A0A8E2JW85_9PEZI|nr:ribosomal protein S5 domain 2-like protein [Glonium stellatum]